MSGHSKWHNIQKTKGAADAKRSQAFTKIAREMIVAVKEGGSGDPNNNSRLATVIAKAKAANMPNDNIKRTIDKALGAGNTDSYEAVTYEGYGPGGVAVIVEALTDNRQRTAPEVRHAFDKCNGNLGAIGCVSWSFDKKGVIVIDNEDGELDEDTVMMDALEAGAADCLYQSAKAADGEPRIVGGDLETIMAGLACGEPNTVSWDILRNHADAFVSCPDWVSANGTRIYGAPIGKDERVISGESGSVTLGLVHALMTDPRYAELKQALKLDGSSEVLLVSSEGDTDPDRYREIAWEGLCGTQKKPFGDL